MYRINSLKKKLNNLKETIKTTQSIGLRVIEFEGETVGIGYAKFLITFYKTKLKLEMRK